MFILFLESQSRLSKELGHVLGSEALSFLNIQDYNFFESYRETNSFPDPDIIILDQYFETRIATHFLPMVKKSCPKAKIIVLAEVEGAKERVRFLELGADDCMTKPIDITELLIRIRKLYDRSNKSLPRPDKSLKTQINANLHDVEVSGERLFLSRKEFLVAETFLSHPKQVFSRLVLLDLGWGFSSEVESNVVEVTIGQIRKKLMRLGADVKIESRRNVGYWLDYV